MTARRASIGLGLMLIVFAAVIALTAFGVSRLGTWVGFFLVYQWIFNQITNYGMDVNLARIAAILIGSAVWYAAIYTWRNNRKWSVVVVLGLLVLQSGFLYFANVGRYFSPQTGEATKFYTINPLTHAIQLFDRPIYDAFQRKAMPVTFEIAQRLERQRRSSEFPNDEVPVEKIKNFFDPYTGEALVFYCQSKNGDYHLYLRPGYDTTIGVALSPVTQEIVNVVLPKTAEGIISDPRFSGGVVIIPLKLDGSPDDKVSLSIYIFGEWNQFPGEVRRGIYPSNASVSQPFTTKPNPSTTVGWRRILPSTEGNQFPDYSALINCPPAGNTVLVGLKPDGAIDLYSKDQSGHVLLQHLEKARTRYAEPVIPTAVAPPPQPTSNHFPDHQVGPEPSPWSKALPHETAPEPSPWESTPSVNYLDERPKTGTSSVPNSNPWQKTSSTQTPASQYTIPRDKSAVRDSQQFSLPVEYRKNDSSGYGLERCIHGWELKRGFWFSGLSFDLQDDREARRYISAMRIYYWSTVPLAVTSITSIEEDDYNETTSHTGPVITLKPTGDIIRCVEVPLDIHTWAGKNINFQVGFVPPDNKERTAAWWLGSYDNRAWGSPDLS